MMRHSIAWPRIASSSCAIGSLPPAAILIIALTRSSPGDHFRNGVLDLQPGVDLHEVERAVLGAQELDGAGVDVTDGLNRADGELAKLRCACFLVDDR